MRPYWNYLHMWLRCSIGLTKSHFVSLIYCSESLAAFLRADVCTCRRTICQVTPKRRPLGGHLECPLLALPARLRWTPAASGVGLDMESFAKTKRCQIRWLCRDDPWTEQRKGFAETLTVCQPRSTPNAGCQKCKACRKQRDGSIGPLHLY